MPFPPIPLADSVDVPLSEGVPALLGKSAAKSAEAVASGFAGDALESWKIQRARQGWGIFDNKGQRVLGAGSVEMVRYTKPYTINSAPQEEGSFTSYDKVALPGQGTLRFICDGSEDGYLESLVPILSNPHNIKKTFLSDLEAICGNTEIYTIRTPEQDYHRMNVNTYDIERQTRSGVSMIIVDVHLVEARSTGTKGYTATKTPSGAQIQNGGVRQPITS